MKKIPYFYDLDTSEITQAVVLLDVEGTLLAPNQTGTPGILQPESLLDQRTIAAVGRLAAHNTVYLCSNNPQSAWLKRLAAALGNVAYHESNYSKPDRAAVADILPNDGRAVIVIGDSFMTDGLLAHALGAPCLQVATLRGARDSMADAMMRRINERLWRLFAFLIRPPFPEGPLTLLTKPPRRAFSPFSALRGLFLHAPVSGGHQAPPRALLRNLVQGLTALSVPFLVNPQEHRVGKTVGVLFGADTLRWAIEQKRKGFIETIIAGPNIVVAPADEEHIIKNGLIDRVVVPSEWGKRWWLSFDQLFEKRALVWASGVEDRGASRAEKGVCLVYSKNADEKVFQKIIEILWTYKLPIVVSHYGKFKHEEYHRLLKKAKMVVYLSEFELDGQPLREAWMADIPTLVWSRGFMEYQGRRFDDPEVGAPYMRPECGTVFTGDGDFERKLIEFLEKYTTFAPRQYARGHFAAPIAARRYLDIVEGAQSKKM